MNLKLSEIFVPLSGKSSYSAAELSALGLQTGFIQKVADLLDLPFQRQSDLEGNLCFAENKEIRSEYRNSFSKAEVLEIILPQVINKTVDLEQDEVVFPENVQSFFQNPINV